MAKTATKTTKKIEPIAKYKTDFVKKEELGTYPKHIRDMYLEKENLEGYYYLPEYEWVQWRQHGPSYMDPEADDYIPYTIGGSDIGKIVYLPSFPDLEVDGEKLHGNRFQSLKAFWAEKTGADIDFPLAPKKANNGNTLFNGHVEEESCRKMFRELYLADHPMDICDVQNDTVFYQCQETNDDGTLKYPFIVCNLDGTVEINGVKGGLECKTCLFQSPDFKVWKNDVVPLSYYLQVQWYMQCTGLQFFYVIVKLGIGDYRYFRVDRDEELIKVLLKAAEEFISCCENGTEPDEKVTEDNAHLVYEYYIRKMGTTNDSNGSVEELPHDDLTCGGVYNLINTLDDLEKAKKRVAELEKERDELVVDYVFKNIKDLKADHYELHLPNSDEVVELSFRKKPSAASIDTEALKNDNPVVYEKYLVEQAPKFNTKGFKKDCPDLAEKYTEKKSVTDTLSTYCKVVVKENK